MGANCSTNSGQSPYKKNDFSLKSTDYLIVGAGVSGTSAMLALKDEDALLFDVASDIIETKFEQGAAPPTLPKLPAKLRMWGNAKHFVGPSVDFFSDNHPSSLKLPLPVIPGGLSRFWGGGLFPYTQEELSSLDWPLEFSDFEIAYDELGSLITYSGGGPRNEEYLGVNRTDGSEDIPISLIAHQVMARLEKAPNRLVLDNALVALDTRQNSPQRYIFQGKELFLPDANGAFSAETITAQFPTEKVHRGSQLTRFEEKENHVVAHFRDAGGGETVVTCKYLLLALGTISTTSLVIRQHAGTSARVPFVEHAPFFLPIFSPTLLGRETPSSPTYPAELNGYFQSSSGKKAHLSFYSPLTAPVSILAEEMMLTDIEVRKVLPAILPSLGMVQIWEEVSWDGASYLEVSKNRITVRSNYEISKTLVKEVAREFRKLGFLSFPMIGKQAGPGEGFHWCGTLPMRANPDVFETNPWGRLWNSDRVYAVDGSILPSLAAKNHSMVMMANAYRIAASLR